MINFEQFYLDNGLQVIVHEDPNTEIAVLNLLYKVGSRDEDPNKTGFAHLFEHLMFGGSKNVESFDEALQEVGGENNAFTSTDITNYYITIPANNLETAFWLESDRMLSLSFDPEVLEVQRKVVIEEFKQRYLDQPYGDVWLKLRPLAYKTHPYNWATIGKEVAHIEDATMDDVKQFFQQFYAPNNAILVVAGNVTVDQIKSLSEKWFGPIEKGPSLDRSLPVEPKQKEKRWLDVEADVPASAFYMAFHMPGRKETDYHRADLLSDVLGRGKSSRLHQALVKDESIFNSIGAYVTGSADPGLLVVSGKLNEGITFQDAEKKVWEVISNLLNNGLEESELGKVKNKAESSLVFSEMELLNTAMNLAYSAFLGNPDFVNQEIDKITAVTVDGVLDIAKEILVADNCNVLAYAGNKKETA
ncbi:MAG: insulinase family protein [bacterium]|nr:insulinase family protein [bacterium]